MDRSREKKGKGENCVYVKSGIAVIFGKSRRFCHPPLFCTMNFQTHLFHILRFNFWLKGVGVILNQKTFSRGFALFPQIFFLNLMNSVQTMNKEKQCKRYIIFTIEVLLVVAK